MPHLPSSVLAALLAIGGIAIAIAALVLLSPEIAALFVGGASVPLLIEAVRQATGSSRGPGGRGPSTSAQA